MGQTTRGLALLLLATMLPSLVNAYQEALPRYALVVGNAKYGSAPLANPGNDARDMAAKLKKLRYRVHLALDQNPAELRDTVARFYRDITEYNAVSLFYYAGHAVQVDNSNYLIPIDAQIETLADIRARAYPISALLSQLRDSASDQNIIILDACRDNPFATGNTTTGSRGLSMTDRGDSLEGAARDIAPSNDLGGLHRGLAPVEAPPGTLVAYATEPGNVAEDGRARNGTYTQSLLRHIERSETAEALFKKVRRDVLRATKGRQTPWEHSSLLETFYFSPPKNEEVPSFVGF